MPTNRRSFRLVAIAAVLSFVIMIGFLTIVDSEDSTATGTEFTVGPYNYVTTSSNTVQLVTPVSGSMVNVTIPNSVEYLEINYSVTSIADNAFYEMDTIETITIPNTITSIGENAFAYCRNVNSLNYDAPALTSSSQYMFAEIGMTAESTSVVFGPHVVEIPDKMFFYSMVSPKTSKITSVTINGNVTSVGDWAFYCCNNLTTITLPNSLVSIGERAFMRTALTSITIPSNVTNIGVRAFSDCSGLTSVTIPQNVTTLGEMAFYDCANIDTVILNASLPDYQSAPGLFGRSGGLIGTHITLTIGDGVTRIPSYFATGSPRIDSVTIPSSVRTISSNAFSNDTYLSTVTMYGIPSFGSNCFKTGSYMNNKNVTIYSICESGFLDEYGGSYTSFTYNQFPHVSLDMSGHTPSPVPDGWFFRNGSLLKYFEEGDDIIIPTITVTGYDYKGLNTTPAAVMPSSSLIYQTIWDIKQLTISFDSNGGSGSQTPLVVNYNQNVNLPNTTTFTKSGRSFGGWSTVADGQRIYNLTYVKNDATLYARWNVTITFNSNGGSGSQQSVTTSENTLYVFAKSTTFKAPSGKIFAGWSLSKNGSAVQGFTPTQNTTVYAVWADNGTSPSSNYTTYYTITLKTENLTSTGKSTYLTGGKVTGGGSFASGSTVTLKATPEKGWKFDKWSDGVTTESRSYTVQSDATLTATFSMIDVEEEAYETGQKIGTGIIVGGIVASVAGIAIAALVIRKLL